MDIIEKLERQAEIEQRDSKWLGNIVSIEAAHTIKLLRAELERFQQPESARLAEARITELEERLKSAQGAMQAYKEREREAFDSAFGSEAIMREIVHAVDDAATLAGARTAVAEIYRSNRAARGQLGAVPVTDSDADEIVTRLYRRFKDWSRRGFGPDDVTWCEVKADVMAMISALTATGGRDVADHPIEPRSLPADAIMIDPYTLHGIRALAQTWCSGSDGADAETARHIVEMCTIALAGAEAPVLSAVFRLLEEGIEIHPGSPMHNRIRMALAATNAALAAAQPAQEKPDV